MQTRHAMDTPYSGEEKIIIGIDIGTTYSTSFVVLTLPVRAEE
jgi:hypothetical protein